MAKVWGNRDKACGRFEVSSALSWHYQEPAQTKTSEGKEEEYRSPLEWYTLPMQPPQLKLALVRAQRGLASVAKEMSHRLPADRLQDCP